MLLLGVVGMGAFAYSYSQDVGTNFFFSDQSGFVPYYDEDWYYSPVSFSYSYGSCSTTTRIQLSGSAEEGTAYALIVGNYIVADDGPGYRALETVDVYEYEWNDEYQISATAACVDSQYAAKIEHYGMITNVDESTSTEYDLTITSDLYYAFYGNE